jgi:hypothetical protein
MDPTSYVRPCRSCLSPVAWRAFECDACGYVFSAAEMHAAAALLEHIADRLALRYQPGTPEHEDHLAEQRELEQFLGERGAGPTEPLPAPVEPPQTPRATPRVSRARPLRPRRAARAAVPSKSNA